MPLFEEGTTCRCLQRCRRGQGFLSRCKGDNCCLLRFSEGPLSLSAEVQGDLPLSAEFRGGVCRGAGGSAEVQGDLLLPAEVQRRLLLSTEVQRVPLFPAAVCQGQGWVPPSAEGICRCLQRCKGVCCGTGTCHSDVHIVDGKACYITT